MIYSYKYKKIDDIDILYLYFDFSDEFFNKNSFNNIDDYIRNFINKNKILFKTGIITIVIGGSVFYKVWLNDINTDPIIDANYNIVNYNNDVDDSNSVESYEIVSNDDINKVNDNASNEVISNNNVTITDEVETSSNNGIYVNVLRSDNSYINLELEEYVVGVVGAEMPASFPSEALKSQAVIARTYALKTMSRGKTLTDSVSTQRYMSNSELKQLWGNSFDTYYQKVKNAVYDTSGLYLSYNGDYCDCVYHSTSNGKTENSVNVWGNYYPYLVSVDSSYDSVNPSFLKDTFISYSDISKKLNILVDDNTVININDKTESGRVSSITIGNKNYTGVELRNFLGLRSTDFSIDKNNDGLIFHTRGYGHGVGLSQYGASGMASSGYSFQDILKHYYTGVTINHI